MSGVSAETFSGYKQRENQFVWNKQVLRTKTKQKSGVVTVALEVSQFGFSFERPLTMGWTPPHPIISASMRQNGKW